MVSQANSNRSEIRVAILKTHHREESRGERQGGREKENVGENRDRMKNREKTEGQKRGAKARVESGEQRAESKR
jgi:hypothetical protein